MDKIQSVAISPAQLSMLQKMQQNALSASQGFIAPAQQIGGELLASPASSSSGSFSQMMNEAVNRVDMMQHTASAKQTAVETGISDDLTGAMVESQKASVAFSAMVQVRNKLTSALDEVMNMAV
ncbi:flagellar hook-basal body complex protein FliE [Buttiauxella warmboldiae]|uniref:Flagellar hook-basal body complex protein FliE n=1 Tax=Buttiauxella warmboldiae TaxID=82993 RepID=A0A3N5DPD6_9ENTR|nr:flagellar hook-basal body complex protein FliE [Buttiauxella warmboldiae]RPH29467.1 flagellar hook-basal body complex protein FliE [Buttiauxella warmboldiae]